MTIKKEKAGSKHLQTAFPTKGRSRGQMCGLSELRNNSVIGPQQRKVVLEVKTSTAPTAPRKHQRLQGLFHTKYKSNFFIYS